jgi:hypothetical protein
MLIVVVIGRLSGVIFWSAAWLGIAIARGRIM